MTFEELFTMTWGQIRLQAQKWAGESADLDFLDNSIQNRYQTILDAHPWKALDKEAIIQTVVPYATGTIAMVLGSASVTGTGTTWVTGMTGRSIRIGSDNQLYTFTYASGTTGTLDRVYEGTTNATATYQITKSIYALPSDLKILLEVNNPRGNYPLRPYTQSELNLLYPSRLDVGEPFIYAMAQDDSTPVHQVEFYKIPLYAAGYPIRYTQNPSTFDPTTTTASPLPWIPSHVITNGVRADILALQKDYQGMMAFESLFTGNINEMLRTELHRQPNARLRELDRYQGPAKFPMPPGKSTGGQA
jgi:hypothetical protein